MRMTRHFANIVERITRTHIYRTLPRGVDVFFDIQKHLPTYSCRIIFDVGANVGQSALVYRGKFPTSTIYCFEPVVETFQHLTSNTCHLPNLHCFQMALGRSQGNGRMAKQGLTMSQLEVSAAASPSNNGTAAADVQIQTLDGLCREQGISQIDYLKIDTEGHDLAVLEGAIELLSSQKIGLVEAEVGMNPMNTRHVPFHRIQTFMEQQNYFLFGIYEQAREWPTNEPHLRRSNCVYVSKQLIDLNRVPVNSK